MHPQALPIRIELEAPVDILLVDDNPNNLLALEATLANINGRFVKASSGGEALKCLLHQDFALIILDIQMPDMDGFETAAMIRGRERSRRIPIIFLTAFNRSDTQVNRGYALGAVDFLFKPIVPRCCARRSTCSSTCFAAPRRCAARPSSCARSRRTSTSAGSPRRRAASRPSCCASRSSRSARSRRRWPSRSASASGPRTPCASPTPACACWRTPATSCCSAPSPSTSCRRCTASSAITSASRSTAATWSRRRRPSSTTRRSRRTCGSSRTGASATPRLVATTGSSSARASPGRWPSCATS
jgi:CheY-like chemotaxis protein